MLDGLLRGEPAGGVSLVDGDRRLGPVDVGSLAARLAAGLLAEGVAPGDTVAWQLPNGIEAVLAYRACWRIGAVAAPLHHRDGPAEVDRRLTLLHPALTLRSSAEVEALIAGAPTNHGTRGGRSGPYRRAVVLFTSGSSGESKGVVHTHGSLADRACGMGPVHGLGPADVVLMPAPLAHVSGLLNGVLVPGAVGMKVVLVARWDPGEALELIERERVTFMVGPPTFFLGLLEDPGFAPERVASMRVVSCGGTGVSPSFVEEAAAALGARVKRSYGSTEAPTVATWHEGDPPGRAAHTDGRAVHGVELRIVDGELHVRGRGLFAGYLGSDGALWDGDRGAGPRLGRDGWFRTGDRATIDEAGWLTVTGRVDDLIIRGGENIAPREIEAVLEAHPAVRRAVAVGLPHERLGEVPAVVLVADEQLDEAACASWMAEHGLARFKAPVTVLHVDAVPLLPSGKPDRRAARDLLVTGRQTTT